MTFSLFLGVFSWVLCVFGSSIYSVYMDIHRNYWIIIFCIIFGLVSSLCRCLKYATAKGSKSGKNTERDEVACPRFYMFWVFFMVVKHECSSVKGQLHSVVIPASRKWKSFKRMPVLGVFHGFWLLLGHPFTLFIWTFVEITESSFLHHFWTYVITL